MKGEDYGKENEEERAIGFSNFGHVYFMCGGGL
jgi:hypothetical protein